MSWSPTETLLLIVLAVGALFMLWRRFGPQSKALPLDQLLDLKRKGALVLDVRTAGEYAGGHLKGSRNIPLGALTARLGELKTGKIILTCCASGARSASAQAILLKAGFKEVHNAGPWQTLRD
jgi:rhodanese-related sulfurtransferase